MERMSSKHSPRVDDQLGHEVESLVRGNSAEESRAREDRLQEGASEDEIRLDDVAGVDHRSELARHIATAHFPAGRDELLQAARQERAPQALLDELRHLPNEARFENVQEVWAALGGDIEDHHTGADTGR